MSEAVFDPSQQLRAATGYRPDPVTQQAIKAILAQSGEDSARALLVTGEPGTGKTSMAEALAKACHAKYYYAQLHPWSTVSTFFADGDIPGILTLTARSTNNPEYPMTLVCLDEMDKTSLEFEAVFLDWLQSGRVPDRPGDPLRTDMTKLIVIITSNGMRPHSDALLRRCRRLRMLRMPDKMAISLTAERSGCSQRSAELAVQLARGCERVEDTVLSLQEIVRFMQECLAICETEEHLKFALAAWYVRRDRPDDVMRAHALKEVLPSLFESIQADRALIAEGKKPE